MTKIIGFGLLFAAVVAYSGPYDTGFLGIKQEAPSCPRECDHFCILKSTGAICSCKEGFRLYDDLKTCVLTEELLEGVAEEMSYNIALPVVIVLMVGFLVILCMAIITWYCVTRDSTPPHQPHYGSQNSFPIDIKNFNKPLHISIV